ncbi:MAG: FAD-dependent oxidoreductase [Methanomassiliicoccales archaeon]
MGSPRVLVIGGGPAGLSASADLYDAGADVVLVEKEDFLGGTPLRLHYSLIAPDLKPVQEVLGPLIQRVEKANFTKYTQTTVISAERKENKIEVAFDGKAKGKELFDAVIIATGFSHWDPHKKYEYGYGTYPDVIDFKDFERMLSTEDLRRPSDGRMPSRIAWLLCVGSRDRQVGKFYCCRLGCAVSIKQAMEVRKKHPEIDTYVYYMDIRTYGFWEDQLYWKSMEEYDVKFIRGRIGAVGKGENGQLIAMAEDTILQRPSEVPFDMLVLATGMEASQGTVEMAKLFNIDVEEHGFIKPLEADSMPVNTSMPNVFVAGTATGPKAIPDAITEGSAAAMKVIAAHMRKVREIA